MEDSIFTKIIRGDVPCHKIYEDDHVFAFLDINPAAEGHTLVVPKRQVEFVWDLPEVDYTALMSAVKAIAVHLRDVLNVPYVGELVVGVDVPHAHVHLIPFETAETMKRATAGSPASDPDHDALAAVAAKVAL